MADQARNDWKMISHSNFKLISSEMPWYVARGYQCK